MEELFEHIYKENFLKVQFYAYSYLKDISLAENVAQEAFVQLWKNKEKVDLKENVLPYVIFITRNLALNILRKEKNHNAYVNYSMKQDRETLAYASLMDSTSFNLYYKEIELLTKKAINSLPDKIRETFLLSRNERLNYKQIAEKQGISVKTVESRISAALKIIRKYLKDYLN